MIAEQKIAVFQKLLDEFETEEIRLYCEDMIKQIPDYIFDIPSSTSGKHHNKTQCQIHGQIYHIIMFGAIMNYRLALKCNKEKFKSQWQRDAMRCVPIFHDALKCGSNKIHTVHEHPILAHDWVLNAEVDHNIPQNVKEVIADMCAAHSGEYTTSNRSKIILPEPKNAMEIFVHECDILSSRSDIDMTIPEYLQDIFIDDPIEFDDSYCLTFGKYNGEKLIDVYNSDPNYIQWLEDNTFKRDVRQQIKAMKEKYNNAG